MSSSGSSVACRSCASFLRQRKYYILGRCISEVWDGGRWASPLGKILSDGRALERADRDLDAGAPDRPRSAPRRAARDRVSRARDRLRRARPHGGPHCGLASSPLHRPGRRNRALSSQHTLLPGRALRLRQAGRASRAAEPARCRAHLGDEACRQRRAHARHDECRGISGDGAAPSGAGPARSRHPGRRGAIWRGGAGPR